MAAALVVAATAPAAPSAAAADFAKQAYVVPVTQPDEYGAPVGIDTDVYVPNAAPPAGGRPLLVVFHGGGSSKSNEFDAGHAARFAARGYVVVLYSARGHGNSGGQTSVAGPKEERDLFDVLAWTLGIGGRLVPPHPDFAIDRSRIALSGYSQGGLNTNVGQVTSDDTSVDPYGIRFRAIEPGNTPDRIFDALVQNGVVKLSFGVGLLGTYAGGTNARVAPIVSKWIAVTAADQPTAYGGDVCDASSHDSPGSTMKADLAWRSAGCFPSDLALPWHWAQAFDDTLFTPDMAISMWRRAPSPAVHRLYLSMGGHGAPSAPAAVEEDKLTAQIAFLDAVMAGRSLPGPPIVYWTRDPAVAVPATSYAYPAGAWYRQTSGRWPPPRVSAVTYRLGADGSATRGSAPDGDLPLSPITENESTDPVAQAGTASTPPGTSLVQAIPATNLPGFIASFRTAPFSSATEMSGAALGRLAWTPAGPDTQLVLKLFDEAPDGTLMLITRGVQGLRGEQPGTRRVVEVPTNTFSVRIPRGHRVLAWVMAGDAGFYKPYADLAGGALSAGGASTLALPIRAAAAAPPTPHRGRRHRHRHRHHRGRRHGTPRYTG